MEAGLKAQSEVYLGIAIELPEFLEAKAYAERKLERIIEREGDADGERRKPYYIAQLIAEAVRENRFSRLTMELYELSQFCDEQNGTKKEQPVSNDTKPPITPCPYCITENIKMQ